MFARLIAIPGIAALAADPADAEEVTDRDRFELWTKCSPVKLYVWVDGFTDEDREELSERITAMARSRLRAARVYAPPDSPASLTISEFAVHVSLLQNSPIRRFFFGNGRFFLIGGLDMEPSLWYGAGVTATTYGETAPCPCDHPYQMPGSGFKGNFSRPSPGRSARWA